jgi:hypothetical protein
LIRLRKIMYNTGLHERIAKVAFLMQNAVFKFPLYPEMPCPLKHDLLN